MDYEKLHKDTISKLQEMVNNGKITVKIARGICADFIPESEDERIRKTIIDHFEGSHSSMYPYKGFTKKQILAWLEKQGEHANFRNKIQVGDKVTRNKNGVLVNLSQLKRIAKPAEKQGKNNMGISEATKQELENNLNKALEKETPESWNKFLDEQGEQKPTIEMITPEESLGIDSDTYNKIVDECVYGEQKHADKIESRQEELTEFEKAVKQVMEEAIECGDTHNLKADADMLLRLVQNHSWSEEEEEMLSNINDCIRNLPVFYESININGENKITEQFICAAINWLKSLKDRYAWKPSDEQMDALNDVISSRDIKYDVLSELWKDLKKLKG